MKVSDAERQLIVGGCRCKEHWGLAETMIELCGDDFGLPRALGHQAVNPMVVQCDGSMTCGCEKCVGERRARTAQCQGVKRRQPWEPVRHG